MLKRIPDKISEFIASNHVLHMATISSDKKKPQIATVYYVFDKNLIYIPIRSDSVRIKNISANKNIAFVITEEKDLETLQIEGTADIVKNPETEIKIIKKYSQISNHATPKSLPPIIKIEGSLKIVKCTIEWFRYSDFSGPKQFIIQSKF